MKKVVLLNDLVPSDITYGTVYDEYKNLLERDIVTFLLDPLTLVDVCCPGCGKEKNGTVYEKMKLTFKACSQCGTHYVSPRPDHVSLNKFYEHSAACMFWRRESLHMPASKLHNLHGPRINWVVELTDEFLKDHSFFVDFETKYPYFIEQIHTQKLFQSTILYDSKVYEQSGLLPDAVVVENNLEQYKGRVSIVTAFECIERMFDPSFLFSAANECCMPGGLLLITTATCSGFEFQVLGEHAPNINPINRMNLLSLEVLRERIQSAGFEIIELSTPGRLDVEVVRRAIRESENAIVHPFWKYIFQDRGEDTWQNLQNFLQLNRLSSHVRIAARKK